MFQMATDKKSRARQIRRGLEIIMVLVLALYPLRHIHRGLDLWDVGYNYANFQYMGTESMDPMWLFSTYLATALGHFFTLLAYGKTIIGLNFYTSLVVSLIAVVSYVFCTRRLGISPYVVFVGEFAAISLCWCPTALLYNYLTYLLLLLCVINIYIGLTESKRHCLFIAGICLGLNVFVRFSNLPEAALIVGVWAYGVLELLSKIKGKTAVVRRKERKEFFKKLGIRTFWCIFGYLTAFGGMLLYIGIRYGIDEYVAGIKRLFAMTEEAKGYSPFAMITSIIYGYRDNARWVILIAAVAVGCIIIVALGKMVDARLGIQKTEKGVFGKKISFTGAAYFVSVLAAAGTVYLLCVITLGQDQYSKFGYGAFDEYSSIIVPGIVLTFIMILWAAAIVLFTGDDIKNKLIAGLVLLLLLITPIGSNNGLLTSMNNLFLASPWFANRVWRLMSKGDSVGLKLSDVEKKNKDRKKFVNILVTIKSYLSLFPVKVVIIAVLSLCLFRFTIFGYQFSFAEAKNARNTEYCIGNRPMFRGIRMSYDKAINMYGLVKYLEKSGVSEDRELITYGYIPALSFYLQIPSAFNPWIDLGSYNYPVLAEQINMLIEKAEGEEPEGLPLVITTSILSKYADGENDEEDAKEVTDGKFKLIMDLLRAGEYTMVYKNDMFAVFVDGK